MNGINLGIRLAAAAALLLGAEVHAQDPYQAVDDAWISISGEIEEVAADSFSLNYGDGLVTVEMDDGDRDADGYNLLKGDKVTVYGMIDDDLYERTTLEASSVHVDKIDAFFYASARDEEDNFVNLYPRNGDTDTVVNGTVVATGGDEFTLYTGTRQLTIDVEDMAYNPLDGEGYQRISAGDRVSVSGDLGDDFFEGLELDAKTVVTIQDRPVRQEG